MSFKQGAPKGGIDTTNDAWGHGNWVNLAFLIIDAWTITELLDTHKFVPDYAAITLTVDSLTVWSWFAKTVKCVRLCLPKVNCVVKGMKIQGIVLSQTPSCSMPCWNGDDLYSESIFLQLSVIQKISPCKCYRHSPTNRVWWSRLDLFDRRGQRARLFGAQQCGPKYFMWVPSSLFWPNQTLKFVNGSLIPRPTISNYKPRGNDDLLSTEDRVTDMRWLYRETVIKLTVHCTQFNYYTSSIHMAHFVMITVTHYLVLILLLRVLSSLISIHYVLHV